MSPDSSRGATAKLEERRTSGRRILFTCALNAFSSTPVFSKYESICPETQNALASAVVPPLPVLESLLFSRALRVAEIADYDVAENST